jgi:hypothetical protein
MKIRVGCKCPDIHQNGGQDSRTFYRVFLVADLVKKQLPVHVLVATACLIEVKRRFKLTWH